jgi:hypothetical protein
VVKSSRGGRPAFFDRGDGFALFLAGIHTSRGVAWQIGTWSSAVFTWTGRMGETVPDGGPSVEGLLLGRGSVERGPVGGEGIGLCCMTPTLVLLGVNEGDVVLLADPTAKKGKNKKERA